MRWSTTAWQRAVIITDPKADSYSLNHTEEKNIKMGFEQLAESWLDLKTLYGSTADTVVEYAEIFRTAAEMKKSLLDISEIEDATYIKNWMMNNFKSARMDYDLCQRQNTAAYCSI